MSTARETAFAVDVLPVTPWPEGWSTLPEPEFDAWMATVRCGECHYCGCSADSSVEPVALVTYDEGDEPLLMHEVCTRRDGEAEAKAMRAGYWTETQMEAYGLMGSE